MRPPGVTLRGDGAGSPSSPLLADEICDALSLDWHDRHRSFVTADGEIISRRDALAMLSANTAAVEKITGIPDTLRSEAELGPGNTPDQDQRP